MATSFSTGPEYRLQAVYGEEIWLKLKRAGVTPEMFNNSDVLEVCAGTGFLTYHSLSRCRPRHLTVNDLSAQELNAANELLSPRILMWLSTWLWGICTHWILAAGFI